MTRLVATLLVIAIHVALHVVIAAPLAHAQPADPKAEAAALFADGEKQYQAGKYTEAAASFAHAYDLDADPGYLFNAAQAYRLAKDCPNAARYYRMFLDAIPDPPNAAKVKSWLAESEACAGTTNPTTTTDPLATRHPGGPVEGLPPAPNVTPTPAITGTTSTSDSTSTSPTTGADGVTLAASPPPPPPAQKRIPALVAAGLGAVFLGTSGYFAWHAHALSNERADLGCSVAMPCESSTLFDLDDRGVRSRNIAIATGIAGGVFATASVVLFVLSREHHDYPLAMVPTSGGAMALGSFAF